MATVVSDLIQLKALKIHDRLSEETTCFSANIYMDGKKVGEASNRGNGGCHDIQIVPERQKAFDEAVAKYKEEFAPEFEFDVDDQLIDAVMEEQLLAKDMKKKTIFTLDGKTMEVNAKYSAEVKTYILEKYPGAEILNKEFVE